MNNDNFENFSNFAAAFENFGLSVAEFDILCESSEEVEVDQLYTEIYNDIIDQLDEDVGQVQFITLGDKSIPSQLRCGSHTLALIGSTDSF